MKIYCEHGAITSELRTHQRSGRIELIHFRYDPDARSRHLSPSAIPSEAQWRDLNVTWEELNCSWNDFSASEYLDQIYSILGGGNRRDALHIDSAYKAEVSAL